MLAKVTSFATIGLDGAAIQVEVDISRGLIIFIIVGLPDAAVQESKERVRAAIKNSGGSFPDHRFALGKPAVITELGCGMYPRIFVRSSAHLFDLSRL
jgi:magnesium chelatase family protein